MRENSPRPPDRKLGLIAPISIALAVFAIIIVALFFRRDEQSSATPVAPPAPPPVAPQPIAADPPVMGRADLLRNAVEQAGQYAAGTAAARPERENLAGRRFAIRIPFGCDGPQVRAGAAQTFYEFDPQARSVRLVARPAVWTTLPALQDTPAAEVEAVEGFWVPRPWSAAENCPPAREHPAPALPTPPSAQSLGLAQLFEAGGSRVRRRGERPYEHVIKLAEGAPPPSAEGFRLVLEGRFARFPQGGSTLCWSESNEHRPLCLYAVGFDRVAFEDAQGKLLAEWRD